MELKKIYCQSQRSYKKFKEKKPLKFTQERYFMKFPQMNNCVILKIKCSSGTQIIISGNHRIKIGSNCSDRVRIKNKLSFPFAK
jgi:hypothetical protein